MTVHVGSTIDGFGAPELEQFADPLFDRGFLKFVEDDHGDRARACYFCVRRQDELVAFAPGYLYERPIPLTFHFDAFLPPDIAGRVVPVPSRWLVLNAPIRLRSRLLARTGEDQRRLLRGVVEWARGAGLAGVVLPFVLGRDSLLVETLRGMGFASSFYEGDFFLSVTEPDFESFLAALPRSPRKRFRSDINRLARAGIRLEEEVGLASRADLFAELQWELMRKYGRSEPEFDAESFRRFERYVNRRTLTVAYDDAGLAGFVLGIHGHGVLHTLRYGKRPDLDDVGQLYGNLAFAASVRHAIRLGCSRVYLGKSSHTAKHRHGCDYEEGHVFALALDPDAHSILRETFAWLDREKRVAFTSATFGSASPSGA